MEMITSHGLRMPKLGLGTWRMKGDECREAVERAFSLGYRHIDTAEMYGNEEDVGARWPAPACRARTSTSPPRCGGRT